MSIHSVTAIAGCLPPYAIHTCSETRIGLTACKSDMNVHYVRNDVTMYSQALTLNRSHASCITVEATSISTSRHSLTAVCRMQSRAQADDCTTSISLLRVQDYVHDSRMTQVPMYLYSCNIQHEQHQRLMSLSTRTMHGTSCSENGYCSRDTADGWLTSAIHTHV